MACILMGRLMTEVKKTVEKEIVVGNENIFCWLDSMLSLWWIKQDSKKWKVWVQNRVLTIRKLVSPGKWFYIPTSVNPADVVTRVMPPRTFAEAEL